MPNTRRERLFFAALTVCITVHAYVFYSIFIVNGDALVEYAGMLTSQPVQSVTDAVGIMGGIRMFGEIIPVWMIVLIEFTLAFTLEMLMGSPCSVKLALRVFDPQKTPAMLVETAVICATVALMCPAMSFLAAAMYFPYGTQPFSFVNLLIEWARLVCLNFPFAFFSQLFFIQPLVRTVFKAVFRSPRRSAQSVL